MDSICKPRHTRSTVHILIKELLKITLKQCAIYLQTDTQINITDNHIRNVAVLLEDISYKYSLPIKSNIQAIHDMTISEQHTTDEYNTFLVYINIVAQFIVHISPSFFTGLHSFLFHEILLLNSEIEMNIDLLYDDEYVYKVWPEIYDNQYLTEQQFISIVRYREMDIYMIGTEILNIIDIAHQADELNNINYLHDLFFNSTILRITTENVFNDPWNRNICFDTGNGCNKKHSNMIILPCHTTSEVCKLIPDDRKIGDNPDEFGYCMQYKEFLDLFCINGLDSIVISPADNIYMYYSVVEQIREQYNRELKMRLYYNDSKMKGDDLSLIPENLPDVMLQTNVEKLTKPTIPKYIINTNQDFLDEDINENIDENVNEF